MTDSRVSSLIIKPDEARDLSHKYMDLLLEETKRGAGVRSGLGKIDTVLNPLKPGQLRIVMGRPSGGKTSLMAHFTRVASDSWFSAKTKTTMPPIFVSAEMSAEEIMVREISHIIPVDSVSLDRGTYEEWDNVHRAIDLLHDERPVIYIGHSLLKPGKRPRLSIENIWAALEEVTDEWGLPPELVSLDYIQRFRLDKVTRDRRIEISEMTEVIKDMSLAFATPVILGSQVGRQVDQKIPPVPTLADGKESGNIEETADSVISVMRPSKYYPIGAAIPGTTLLCTEELFFINILKQRQGASDKGFWCYFDMKISKLCDLEFETVDLNNF